MWSRTLATVAVAVACATTASAQSSSSSPSSSACSAGPTPANAAPSVAPGYDVRLVASDLETPRTIIFDKAGHLLVLQQGVGIQNLELSDDGGTCVNVVKSTTVIESKELNHGLVLSEDGNTLYASSSEAVYAWSYDAQAIKLGDMNKTIVSNMGTSDHVTRTLLLSQKQPDTLVVSRGSTSNIDPAAEDLDSGHCQIKSFNLTTVPDDGYDFNTDGDRLGWGLRNSVGVAEHPVTGGMYSVENSVDEIMRDNKDIHQDNPGEEMNFHGTLEDVANTPGGNHGYPNCVTVWGVNDIPNKDNLTVGSQFVMGNPNDTVNDDFCARERIPPILAFQAHMAPLDIKFNNNGSEAWVTFHGSWDRTNPSGYKLSVVQFEDGKPTAESTSTTAAQDIVANPDNSKCPDSCFRPVGMAWDSQERLFMSSDATGEVYVVMKSSGTSTSGSSPSGTSSGGSAATTTSSASNELRSPCSFCALWIAFALVCFLV
ncbi:MAG: hypothetical protein M4579_007157 [Chaenotheca gracillima]|nr:MAG: hypothetical protein M4579_007157 [Chaenotheca gracillima]